MSDHVAASSGTITSPTWWKAAAIRALRTAIMIAVPYLGTAVAFHGVPWLAIASAAGLGFIASLITSLAGIPEVSGASVPVWLALLERTTKTLAQGLAVGIGNAVLFTDVHWSTILQSAIIAALGSLLLGVLGFLPESGVEPTPAAPSITDAVAATTTPNSGITPQDPDQPAAGTPPSPRDAD